MGLVNKPASSPIRKRVVIDLSAIDRGQLELIDLFRSQDSTKSRTPSPFDYGPRSNSSSIPFSEPPNYSNYTGHFAPSLAPHATFPFVEGFAPNFRLSATATVPYSAAPSSVATSEIGPSQSSLRRNSQDLQYRESANGAKNNAKWTNDQTTSRSSNFNVITPCLLGTQELAGACLHDVTRKHAWT